jgi:hypothetical protein
MMMGSSEVAGLKACGIAASRSLEKIDDRSKARNHARQGTSRLSVQHTRRRQQQQWPRKPWRHTAARHLRRSLQRYHRAQGKPYHPTLNREWHVKKARQSLHQKPAREDQQARYAHGAVHALLDLRPDPGRGGHEDGKDARTSPCRVSRHPRKHAGDEGAAGL